MTSNALQRTGWKERRRLVLALCVLFLMAFVSQCAYAQITGTYTHHFDDIDRRVYLELHEDYMTVWGIHDRTECSAYPKRIRWEGQTLKPHGWRIKTQQGAINVQFSDTTLTYKATDYDPRTLCLDDQQI